MEKSPVQVAPASVNNALPVLEIRTVKLTGVPVGEAPKSIGFGRTPPLVIVTVIAGAGAAVPVPVKFQENGLPTALCEKPNVPVFTPVDVGVNVNTTSAKEPAAIDAGTTAFVNIPVQAAPAVVNAALPVLEMRIVIVVGTLIVVDPKSNGFASAPPEVFVTTQTGAGTGKPVPDKFIENTVGPSHVKPKVPTAGPTAVGVNVNTTSANAPIPIVAGSTAFVNTPVCVGSERFAIAVPVFEIRMVCVAEVLITVEPKSVGLARALPFVSVTAITGAGGGPVVMVVQSGAAEVGLT